MALTAGQLLAQRYLLGRRIAVGGMGEVWAATDTRLDRQVAVKVLRSELSGDLEFQQRFHTEARLTASLNHPGIAAIYDYGETTVFPAGSGPAGSGPADAGDTAFLVMELVHGDSLATILRRQPRLPVDRTLDILWQAGNALQAAHDRGLVHRDIKPGNILITPTGNVKLTDFGIAKAANATPLTRQGMVMGTAHYIAPEQAAGDEAGPASDVYALGVVGYECLAGRRPFQSDNAITVTMMHIRDPLPPLPSDTPPRVRALIETALVKNPQQRYRSGGEFAAAVAAVRNGHSAPPPAGITGTVPFTRHHPVRTALLPPAQHRPPQPRSRRHNAIMVMLLLGVLGLVLGGYAIREALRFLESVPGIVATPQTDGTPPATPDESKPIERETTTVEPTPERDDIEDEPEAVFINLADYLLRSGDVAAATAAQRGLVPLVVDEQGDEIEPEELPECWITKVEPPFGSLPPGSPIELTCTEVL